jgi:hypothetical protein
MRPCSRSFPGAPLALLALSIGFIVWTEPASASCTSPSMCIPPVSGCAYTGTCDVMYAPGIEIKNVTLYDFTSCVVVQPGYTTSGWVECKMDVDLSFDGGLTWAPAQAIPTTCHMVFSGNGQGSHGEDLYLGTIDDLGASGGGLPADLRLRESPIQNSSGTSSVLTRTGDYQIDSFFDVFTELSLDDGMTWYPGFSSCRIVLEPHGPTPARISSWGQVRILYR